MAESSSQCPAKRGQGHSQEFEHLRQKHSLRIAAQGATQAKFDGEADNYGHRANTVTEARDAQVAYARTFGEFQMMAVVPGPAELERTALLGRATGFSIEASWFILEWRKISDANITIPPDASNMLHRLRFNTEVESQQGEGRQSRAGGDYDKKCNSLHDCAGVEHSFSMFTHRA